jgi:RHS repeat-associated protein
VDALGFNAFRGYDTNNNPTYEANHLNQTNWFSHSVTGLLIGATNALGHTNSYTHNSFGQLLTAHDSLSRGTTNSYDDKGNLTNAVDAAGNSTAFLYDAQGRLVSQRDALSNITTNQYDSAGNLTTATVKTSTGQILTSTSFAYDANGNRTNQTTTRTLSDGTAQAVTTTYIYDAQNRLVRNIDPDDSSSSIIYNALGKQEHAIDKLGRTNTFEYDVHGRLTKQLYPDGTFEQSHYDVEGRRTNMLDRSGRSTLYGYDKLGRLVMTVFPDNSSNSIAYDAAGRVAHTVDPRGTTNAFGYDAAGRRTSITNALFTAMQSVVRYNYNAVGSVTNFLDAVGRGTDHEYDVLNRRVKTIFPATVSGGARAFVLSSDDALGRRIAETNEAGVITRFGYDALGRLAGATNAWGTVDATWATYRYDEVGNQTNQVDALGRITRFEYDKVGRRTKRVLPGNQTEAFGYDAAGNLLRHTNFINSQVITNEYDSMNRLLRRWVGSTMVESYAYTPNGLRTARTDASGSYAWGYDSRDRLNVAVSPVGALNYQYDRNGNLTNLFSSTVNGVSVAYQYDALNRATNVIDKRLGGVQNTAYRFDLTGNLKALTYPNGVTNLWEYDSRNRLTNEVWKLSTTTLGSFFYQLGVAGNRTNLSENVNGTGRTYAWGYDQQYRLTNEVISALGNVAYQYDSVGNRTSRQSTISQLPSTSSGYGVNDWLNSDVYDSNGNTRTNGVNVYLYDWANRLTNANNGSITILYNADGHRIRKVAGGLTTLYLVDERNLTGYAQVLEEHTITGSVTNLTKAYTYGLDLISQRQAAGTVHFYGYDGHGSVRFLANTSGTVSDTYSYDAYGTTLVTSGATPNSYRYTGEQFDSDLGVYFLRARYLKTDTGRFLTMDQYHGSQHDPLSLHKYLYAHDNPANMIDPTGHFTMTEILANTQTILNLAMRVLDGMYKVWKLKQRLDTVKTIIEYAQKVQKVFDAMATSSSSGGFSAAVGEAISQFIGDNISLADLAGGIDDMFKHLGQHWGDISSAIVQEIPEMVQKLSYRIVSSPQKFGQHAMNTKDRGISLELPSQPIGELPRVAKRFSVKGGTVEIAGLGRPGRIFQLGFFTGQATTVEPLIGIHYALHAPPGSIAPQTIVHYHIWRDPQRHIPGQIIWP